MPAGPTEARPEGVARGRRRKLAAILSADAVGFSRQMHRDETGTHARLRSCREIIDRLVAEHDGRIVGSAGDSVLADFPSVVEALTCAVDIQRALRERNAALPPEHRLEFRIGINLGDVIIDGEDIYGDGVNVAARLQQLAEPGGILVSRTVHNHVRGKLDLAFEPLGEHQVKNIPEPVAVFRVRLDGSRPSAPEPPKRPLDACQAGLARDSGPPPARRGCRWSSGSRAAVPSGSMVRSARRWPTPWQPPRPSSPSCRSPTRAATRGRTTSATGSPRT